MIEEHFDRDMKNLKVSTDYTINKKPLHTEREKCRSKQSAMPKSLNQSTNYTFPQSTHNFMIVITRMPVYMQLCIILIRISGVSQL